MTTLWLIRIDLWAIANKRQKSQEKSAKTCHVFRCKNLLTFLWIDYLQNNFVRLSPKRRAGGQLFQNCTLKVILPPLLELASKKQENCQLHLSNEFDQSLLSKEASTAHICCLLSVRTLNRCTKNMGIYIVSRAGCPLDLAPCFPASWCRIINTLLAIFLGTRVDLDIAARYLQILRENGWNFALRLVTFLDK